MMKCLFLFCMAVLGTVFPAAAQDINDVTAKGKAAYLEIKILEREIPDARERAVVHLTGPEWNEWTITENPGAADFTLRLSLEKKGMNAMSMRSTGGRVRATVEILDREGNVLWKSKKHQGNATVYTGFDALTDALNKVVRRALQEELRGGKGSEE